MHTVKNERDFLWLISYFKKVIAGRGGGTGDGKIAACFQSGAIKRTIINQNKEIKFSV